MKILAWLMFGTSVICFALCFCRQQLAVQAADAADALLTPTIHWDQLPDPDDQRMHQQSPSTQPSQSTLGARPTIASNDLHDAMK